MPSLSGKTLLIPGASRGIGRAIALRAARDGANIAVLGKTDAPNPKLAGTVHETVTEIERAGGRGIACVCDVRFEDQVEAAVAKTIAAFGGWKAQNLLLASAISILFCGFAALPALGSGAPISTQRTKSSITSSASFCFGGISRSS